MSSLIQNNTCEMTREEFNRAFYGDDFLPKYAQNGPCKKSLILQKNCTGLAGKSSEDSLFYWGFLLEIKTQAGSGLYYFRARYYDAELGRFISRDPLGYVDGLNLYRGYFVPNAMDPSGMQEYSHCCRDYSYLFEIGGFATVSDCVNDYLLGSGFSQNIHPWQWFTGGATVVSAGNNVYGFLTGATAPATGGLGSGSTVISSINSFVGATGTGISYAGIAQAGTTVGIVGGGGYWLSQIYINSTAYSHCTSKICNDFYSAEQTMHDNGCLWDQYRSWCPEGGTLTNDVTEILDYDYEGDSSSYYYQWGPGY